jgi:hypothetical protein
MSGLSINDLVKVDVLLSPQAAPVENFGALLLIGASDAIDTDERIRKYAGLTAVETDLGVDSEEAKAAKLFYGQNPQPSTLFIGRWAKTGSAGLLYGGALTTAQQALTNFTSITDGGLHITVDGTVKTLADLDFTGVTNLNGVASVITTALAGATCVWNAAKSRFEFKSPTTGAASKISFGSAAAGTDLSLLLNLTSSTKAKTVDGIAQESLTAAASILASKSNEWYGVAVAVPSVQDSDLIALAQQGEASTPRKFTVLTTQDINTLDPASTTDLAAQLAALKLNHTAVQYSSSTPYAAVSLFARQASVNFEANASTITLMFKQEPLVSPELLDETQAAALKAKNCNVFVSYNTANNVAIIQHGTVSSGLYIDSIVGTDWLQNRAQADVFNLQYLSETKIPQTDQGANQVVTTLEGTMDAATNNGLCAPGTWTGPAIGPLKTGQTLAKGYFVYCPPMAFQSAADRAARKLPPVQIAAKLAGAIHEVDIIINVVQ